MKNLKTYRDITLEQVEKYADKHGLNIQTEENIREIRQEIFKQLHNNGIKHTPGPWKYGGLSTIHSKGKLVAYFASQHSQANPHETAANGKLIAAAPDLLESLMGLNHLMAGKEEWPEVQRALNAIKKATE